MLYTISKSEGAKGYPIVLMEGKRSGIPTAPELEFWGEILRLRKENIRLRRRNADLLHHLSPKPTN